MEGKGDCDKYGEKIDYLDNALACGQTQALGRVKLHKPANVSESVSVTPCWNKWHRPHILKGSELS